MESRFQAICARETPCKCCGARAVLYGVVDFHKNCEIRRRRVLDLSGIPVYYYRCSLCKLIFTTAFDQFTTNDFQRHIYNNEYILVDPEYLELRPKANANLLSDLFSVAKPGRVLDYGGGTGALAQALRDAGFPDVVTYDPFVPDHAIKPPGRYECVLSFEVLEHSTDPARMFADMNEHLADPGLIVFSTLLQPNDIDTLGLGWWYAAPRNGHVTLYTRASLAKVVRPLGLIFRSFNESLHVMYREIPDFARHFLNT